MEKDIWSEETRQYYEVTSRYAPSVLLTRVVISYGKDSGHALDLGCGSLKDTRYLLSKGFSVTAVDMRSIVQDFADGLPPERFSLHIDKFQDIDFGEEKYDLVNAHYSLYFDKKEEISEIFSKTRASLKSGGIFVGNLLGLKDEWYGDPDKSFHTLEEVTELLEGLEVLELYPIEWDGETADGVNKHWHKFNIIAQKP